MKSIESLSNLFSIHDAFLRMQLMQYGRKKIYLSKYSLLVYVWPVCSDCRINFRNELGLNRPEFGQRENNNFIANIIFQDNSFIFYFRTVSSIWHVGQELLS